MRIPPWKRSIFRAVSLFDETGATAIEYALIAALIGLVIVATLTLTSNALSDIFKLIGNTF